MNRITVAELAEALKRDLSPELLKNYLAEQVRMIENEKKYGRPTRRYEFYKAAAELAIKE